MTTLEASLVEERRAHTRGVVADIVVSRLEEDGSEGDSPFVDLVTVMFPNDVRSSRWVTKIENTAKDAGVFKDVIRRIAEEIVQSGQII